MQVSAYSVVRCWRRRLCQCVHWTRTRHAYGSEGYSKSARASVALSIRRGRVSRGCLSRLRLCIVSSEITLAFTAGVNSSVQLSR